MHAEILVTVGEEQVINLLGALSYIFLQGSLQSFFHARQGIELIEQLQRVRDPKTRLLENLYKPLARAV